MKFNGKTQPQFATSLDTKAYPIATISLSQQMILGSTFASGATITSTAVAAVTLNGGAHRVIVTIHQRRDGSVLQAVGTFPIRFTTWGIEQRAGIRNLRLASQRRHRGVQPRPGPRWQHDQRLTVRIHYPQMPCGLVR